MYGCFVTEPEDADGDLGVVFFHNAGYSTACGHGTIALVTWALESGVLPVEEPETRVVVDVPSGRLETFARVEGGAVRSVRFRNVPLVRRGGGAARRGASRRRRLRRRLLRVRRLAASRAAAEPPGADRARPRRQGGAGGAALVRPPGRAGAARRVRRHLLGAGRHGPAAAAAERHRLRRRRGRPLALRERHVRPARAPRARRRAPARRASSSTRASRAASSAPASSATPRSPAARPCSRRSRAARTARARTSSPSTRPTPSARASCSASGRVPAGHGRGLTPGMARWVAFPAKTCGQRRRPADRMTLALTPADAAVRGRETCPREPWQGSDPGRGCRRRAAGANPAQTAAGPGA